MTPLDAIRARHVMAHHDPSFYTHPASRPAPVGRCFGCKQDWPCDTVKVLAALDRAKAVVAAARDWRSASPWTRRPLVQALKDAIRAYEVDDA